MIKLVIVSSANLTLFIRFEWQFFRLLHRDLLSCDFIVDGRQIVLWQIFTVIDPPIHHYVLLFCHFILHLYEGRKQKSDFN